VSPLLAMFIVVSAVAVAGGAGVVLSRSVVYASLYLLLSLMAVAGVYILLFSAFLAVVQVLIYGGAIIVVVLFALMLTRQQDETESLDNHQKPLAVVTGLATLGSLIAIIAINRWPPSVDPEPVGFEALGTELFTRWAVPFELASLLLLVSLIGAIVIARPSESE
jgi:NADH:ubiquinone oxidoreductase subunit 6 (subunit J)